MQLECVITLATANGLWTDPTGWVFIDDTEFSGTLLGFDDYVSK